MTLEQFEQVKIWKSELDEVNHLLVLLNTTKKTVFLESTTGKKINCYVAYGRSVDEFTEKCYKEYIDLLSARRDQIMRSIEDI